MFRPPFCPYATCQRHRRPRPDFYTHHGTYQPRCRPRPVPRYRCRSCGRTFSRQTFRADRYDKKPHLNGPLVELLASGVGLRQSARLLGLSLNSTEQKFRKLARHLRDLNRNLRAPLEEGVRFQFDEFETYEGRRGIRPLSVPVLIERESRFVIWAESAPIRPKGKKTAARELAILEDELRFGPRKDLSRRSVARTLAHGARLTEGHAWVVLQSDEKPSYPALAKRAFAPAQLIHERTNSELPRTTWNALFPINHTEAMARDLIGRLRRDSWLVSKLRRFLDLGLQLWMAWRNYVRKRFNRDEEETSPAQMLGFVGRRLTAGELVGWRQDWRRRSIHPLSRRGSSVASWLERRAG